MPTTLQQRIGKQQPFDAPEQEAYLNLIRTAALLECDFHRLFAASGLSEATYNTLRILRAAGAEGRTWAQIRDHLVAPASDVTRLVERLEQMELVERARSAEDGRVIVNRITPKGRRALAKLDQPVKDLHASQLGHMSKSELEQMSRLLERAREKRESERSD